MENKINIAELLKDCPGGMELDCAICENVYFDKVDFDSGLIKCFIKNDVYNTIYFYRDGTHITAQNAKCVIFPKGKTTWEGFHRPFKDGDIVFSGFDLISIYKEQIGGKFARLHSYVSLRNSCMLEIDKDCWTLEGIRFATEEEKAKLFDVIKANGYKWNPEYKTLEKLKKEYPKTYKECRKIINYHLTGPTIIGYEKPLLENFQQLLICRDAYWKIAGEEMELGRPWEPDWDEQTDKFTISNKCNKIYLNNTAWYAEVLSFPTAGMRNAFYENFKELIEQCKELL